MPISKPWKMMNLDEKYFYASFRYNKNSPEDFGLSPLPDTGLFVDSQGCQWKQEPMWDEGWGDEYGFVRQPAADAKGLWKLLIESPHYENQRGGAEFLARLYPEELKAQLTSLFQREKKKLGRDLSKRLAKIESLKTGTNGSDVLGKSIAEINKDHEDWKLLKQEFEKRRSKSLFRWR